MSGKGNESRHPPSEQRQVIDGIVGILAECEQAKWFGDLTITLKAGKVQLIRKNEIIKPEEIIDP